MSRELDLVSKVMYLCDGEVQPGDAAKVASRPSCHDGKWAQCVRDAVLHWELVCDFVCLFDGCPDHYSWDPFVG
jgi:hypothetical protein